MTEDDTFFELKLGHLRSRHEELRKELDGLLLQPDPTLIDLSRIRELSDESLRVIQEMNKILKVELDNLNEEIDRQKEKE